MTDTDQPKYNEDFQTYFQLLFILGYLKEPQAAEAVKNSPLTATILQKQLEELQSVPLSEILKMNLDLAVSLGSAFKELYARKEAPPSCVPINMHAPYPASTFTMNDSCRGYQTSSCPVIETSLQREKKPSS